MQPESRNSEVIQSRWRTDSVRAGGGQLVRGVLPQLPENIDTLWIVMGNAFLTGAFDRKAFGKRSPGPVVCRRWSSLSNLPLHVQFVFELEFKFKLDGVRV